jgi:hypothetical protein
LAREHQERIVYLNFRGEYRHEVGTVYSFNAFRQHLINIIDESEHLSAEDIYRRTDTSFFTLLDEVHGAGTARLPMGHRLRKRFSILDYEPYFDFVSECFTHFLDMLYLRNMEDERDALYETMDDNADEMTEQTFLARIREIDLLGEAIKSRDNDLAEQAANIRNTTGTLQGAAVFEQMPRAA